MIRSAFICSLLTLALLAGCHTAPKPDAQTASNPAQYKTYKLRGKVVNTDASTNRVTLNHEAIPGFMEAMTMPYRVKDGSVLSELHPGDVITADLEVSQNDDADIFLDHIVVVGQGKPDYKPTAQYHVPSPGDVVPDFKLRNQSGQTIALNQFHGKELLITFIYTRCPLPEFCPRVTRQFAQIEQQLKADPALYKKTHLLCVSFDPDNDTPARLKAYGQTYLASGAKDAFAHFDFAVPDKKTLGEMTKFFDVGLTNDNGSITHTLSTTLVGADGKVVQFYPGNDWTVDQVMADVKKAGNSGQ